MDNLHKANLQPRQELREQIVSTALSLFTTQGIKGITMDDIASAMGISKRTLYEVFADKETLLLECMDMSKAGTTNYMKEVSDSSANVMEVLLKLYQASLEQLHKVNPKFFEDIKKYPRVSREIERHRNAEAAERMAFYRMGMKQGFFREDINLDIVNDLVFTQLDQLVSSSNELMHKYSFREVYETIMFTYLRGITTDSGARMLDVFIQSHRNNNQNNISISI
ncbi:MAG: TetR/AcrR family transcriptional regulator [Prevotellaceae bacterium]|jgi:AcrR family transcriptional regulator|nr:TetR/AcrR family transcriptional regulator [Prevotellaceae bacterium]